MIISQQVEGPDPSKIQALRDMTPLKMEKELKSFVGILNYLSKFSQVISEVCKPLQKLTFVKTVYGPEYI